MSDVIERLAEAAIYLRPVTNVLSFVTAVLVFTWTVYRTWRRIRRWWRTRRRR